MRPLIALLAPGIALIQACSHTPTVHTAGPEWIDGKTGNLIAFKVNTGETQSDQVVLVESAWAALIVWQEGYRFFCLYDNGHRRYVATESWPAFLTAMESVPPGMPIQRFYKCSVPWDFAMPDSERDQLDMAMKSKRLSWREIKEGELSTLIVCIHGGMKNNGVVFPSP